MITPGGAPVRKCCGNHTYAPHRSECPVGFAEKRGIEVHFMHDQARYDPDHEGMAALCDLRAGLEEEPRQMTLSSAQRNEVTCPDCLRLLEEL